MPLRRGERGRDHRRLRQKPLGLIQQFGGTAQGAHHRGAAFGRPTVVQRRLQLAPGWRGIGRQPAEAQHFAAQRQHQFVQARVPVRPFQIVDGLPDFQGVARRAAQRLIHVGDQRRGGQSRAAGDRDQAVRQCAGLVQGGHERPGAGLDIQDQPLQPFGQFFGQDGGDDQIERFHRGGDVAHRVEPAVGGGQLGGLADDGAADGSDHPTKALEIGGRVVAGDAGQLVHGAAGMAQAPARDHRHVSATGRHQRRQDQADLVADPAGGMLVEHRSRQLQVRPVQHRPGAGHGLGQGDPFIRVQPAKIDGHGEGGQLAFADGLVDHALDQEIDFGRTQRHAVPLAADQVLGQPRGGHGFARSASICRRASSTCRTTVSIAGRSVQGLMTKDLSAAIRPWPSAVVR